MNKPASYGIEVCRNCDPVRPGTLGPEVESVCPECGARLFGLLGSEDMLLGQAFATRDMMHKQALFAEFGDDAKTIERINTAFKKGWDDWPTHMTAIFGRRQVDQLMIIMRIEVPMLYDAYRKTAWRLWVRFLWAGIKDRARQYLMPWRKL